ncbi:MAG: shikimate dehydrogenase [Blastocatellia bacterium]|nr:shikimate dehydrogenase [Blastocatellia bacterium]
MSFSSWICVPITETACEPFLGAITEAARGADVIELRLDFLPARELGRLLEALRERRVGEGKRLLFTFRPVEQGGRRELTLGERQAFWRGLSAEVVAQIDLADFEMDLAESFAAEESPIPWERVICSWHNFDETPGDLIERYDRMARTPAAVVKIATQARSIGDCLRLFALIDHGRGAKPVIALGMGMAGLTTRLLALSRGALLTFGALRRGAESAGGQPTVAELNDLYRVRELTRETEILGIIGNPVGHSRSPLMHNAALRALGRDGVYLPFEVEQVDDFVRDFVRPATRQLDWRLRGLSVTIPHKRAILSHLDRIDETARRIGAVNTLVVEGEELHGYNTDVTGAMQPLDRRMEVRGARVAVIGAGGSARAVCFGASERKADVTVYARDPEKARLLAAEFGAKAASIDAFQGEADILINCTPIGMHGHSEGQSPIRADALQGVGLVYDLIYTPEETALLRAARAAGRPTLGGLEMLLAQAGEQFRLWTGLSAPLDVMGASIFQREHHGQPEAQQ